MAWDSTPNTFDQTLAFDTQSAPPPPQAFWYYCTEPPGYFPYVQSCSRAWIPVTPQVPAQ